jgi:hypothetical protein
MKQEQNASKRTIQVIKNVISKFNKKDGMLEFTVSSRN